MTQPDSNIIAPHEYGLLDPTNPFYPLPRDYESLTVEGKRKARVWAVKQQNTELGFVAAWDCFRRLYLEPTEPGFFYHNYKPSPPFHYEMMYDAAKHARNVEAAPRGFAKSIVIGTELPLFLLLTRPYIRIVLSLATDKLVEGRFETIITQLTDNQYIRDDFGIQKPNRGSAIWNRHYIHLVNGSKLEGFSVTGRKRGARPDLFLLDDPEYDPDNQTSANMLREKFEVMLFKQVIPMLEAGSGIFWIGTIIGSRSFLHHAIFGGDSRFEYWNRKSFAAENPGTDGQPTLLWEGKWNQKDLEIRRKEIGEAHYGSEYLGKVVSEGEKILVVDPIMSEYDVKGGDQYLTHPLDSAAPVTFHDLDRKAGRFVSKTVDARDLFEPMYRILTFDPGRGLKQYNDFSCIMITGVDRFDCLWVLDMWMGRARELTLLKKIWELGYKWKVRVLGIESVGMQVSLLSSITTYIQTNTSSAQDSWCPRVIPVDYEGVRKDKADRIATLEWRFETGKIKYPYHLKTKWPFTELYAQTEDFTYDLALLPHDDAIDSLAMVHFIVHGRGRHSTIVKPEPTLVEMLESGHLQLEGLPLIQGIGVQNLTPKMLEVLDKKSIALRADEEYDGGHGRIRLGRSQLRHGPFRFGQMLRQGDE